MSIAKSGNQDDNEPASPFRVGRRLKVIVRTPRARHAISAAALGAGLCVAIPCQASEYGLQVYPLGAQADMAGVTPPPGVYFSDTVVYYNGSASDSVEFPLGLRLGAGVRELVLVNAATLSVFPKVSFLGGQLGLAATLPYGRVKIDAEATFMGPGPGKPLGAASDTETGIGDLSLTALLGWHNGANHWNLAVTTFLPTGEYDVSSLANVGLHRTAVDVKGAYTWLNPKTGLELSAGLGMTFNAVNSDTNYKTGDELHLEASIDQHFPSGWTIGVGGYQYVQVSGDSGSGAMLGAFEGRATGIGPLVSYTFKVGRAPVQIGASWYHEFGVRNRVSGDSVSLTLAMPLASFVPPPPQ